MQTRRFVTRWVSLARGHQRIQIKIQKECNCNCRQVCFPPTRSWQGNQPIGNLVRIESFFLFWLIVWIICSTFFDFFFFQTALEVFCCPHTTERFFAQTHSTHVCRWLSSNNSHNSVTFCLLIKRKSKKQFRECQVTLTKWNEEIIVFIKKIVFVPPFFCFGAKIWSKKNYFTVHKFN